MYRIVDRAAGAWYAFTGPAGWRAVSWPAAFAVVALGLLVFDHLQDRINHLVFWLCVGLIGCVFAWLVETTRRKSRELALEHRMATYDRPTGLPNQKTLLGDLQTICASGGLRRALVLVELDGLQAFYDTAGAAVADDFVRRLALTLGQWQRDTGGIAYRIDVGRFAAISPAEHHAPGELLLTRLCPLLDAEPRLGGSRACGEALIPDQAASPEQALQLAGQRLIGYQRRQQQSARRQAHAVLMAVLEARRPDLRQHLRGVAFRALSLARRLGLDGDRLDDVFLAAELQDIGLLTVPEAVLEKGAELDFAESALVQAHPVAGAQIIAAAPGLAPVATIVHSIAEQFDGSGTPDGLSGDSIPLGSRIIAVSVAYAAMTAERPYRPALGAAEALAELHRCAGSQFDPTVAAALAGDVYEEPSRSRAGEVLGSVPG